MNISKLIYVISVSVTTNLLDQFPGILVEFSTNTNGESWEMVQVRKYLLLLYLFLLSNIYQGVFCKKYSHESFVVDVWGSPKYLFVTYNVLDKSSFAYQQVLLKLLVICFGAGTKCKNIETIDFAYTIISGKKLIFT